MAIEILRDLRGLRVDVMHPPDVERVNLVDHLKRIGCDPTATWPLPDTLSAGIDLVVVAVEHDGRDTLRRIFKEHARLSATIIGIIGYENPSTLQLVLEIGAHAVIERPIRPFGLLTQLVVARSLWLQQQDAGRRVLKMERKLAGLRTFHRARLLLMTTDHLTENEAYQTIRRQAMAKRMAMEDFAATIVDAHASMQA